MHVVVYGAGAVGSVIGGQLALHKHDVILVGRKHHAEAVNSQKGLRIKSATGEYFAPLTAVDRLSTEHVGEETCIFLTAKANHTGSCVDELAKLGVEVPVVSFQNGIGNEARIAAHCERVYGGVCWMTCSFLHSGQVSLRRIGRLVVGKFPKGSDAFVRKLGAVLEEAGFEVSLSRSIQCDKWLKLVVNLQSAWHAVIDPRDHDTMEFLDLKVGVLEEAKRVLKADKTHAKSCDGRDLSIDELIADLKRPQAPRAASAVRVHNSTWQNLYLKRDSLENGFFHNPIIERARTHDVAVPYNEVALDVVTRCHEQKLGPDTLRAADILAEVQERRAKG